MDRIHIKGLEVFAKHGVSSAENILGQKFRVNAVIDLDIRPSAEDDDISKTVNYGKLCAFITDYMQAHVFRLIETAAERLAQAVLLDFDTTGRIRRIDLEIEKPWAPIGLPLENVSVQISRKWETAYLSVGSNMGDREAYLKEGIRALGETRGIRVEKISDLIETQPYGPVEQDPFLNGAVKISAILTPRQLLNRLHEIEQAAGRERSVRWGPRTLDLDILFYGDEVIHEPDLIIPHPDLENRTFVLDPLVTIDPYLRHPVSGKTMKELRAGLKTADTEGIF